MSQENNIQSGNPLFLKCLFHGSSIKSITVLNVFYLSVQNIYILTRVDHYFSSKASDVSSVIAPVFRCSSKYAISRSDPPTLLERFVRQ
ncbi:hypothetical protein RIR_jg8774.t1 [Rhizophagus irregularis DAOM 181602=DAOM 197198]|nr:hypothetical protein RIR_jg8774.t1 [Rhizophagus irregularis DAOM 181602=DAOM 197198]